MSTKGDMRLTPAERADLCRRAETDPALAASIGDHYRLGSSGFATNPRLAFRWYARSALGGHAVGQVNLGVCYEIGFGCRQSLRQAFHWSLRAAQQGDAVGMNNLGLHYRHGRGVPADTAQAVHWLGCSARAGYALAMKHLARIPEALEEWNRLQVEGGQEVAPGARTGGAKAATTGAAKHEPTASLAKAKASRRRRQPSNDALPPVVDVTTEGRVFTLFIPGDMDA